MFRKGLLLSIIFLLIFSMTGSASFYKYTQESGADFYVGSPDKSDALEDTNELRQIIDDIGNIIGHSKRDDSYPEDGTTGGTAQYTGDGSLLTGVGEATATGLTIDVKEENTSPITKGQPVYVSGSTGAAYPEVGLADSDDSAKYEVIGLAAEDITQNGLGLVRVGGILEGVDSLGATAINPDNETWLPSDLLFLHTTAGGLTKTEPITGRVIEVGYSLYGSSNTDAILLMIHSPHIHIEVAIGEDIVFRMGDSAGVNKTIFKGYDNVEVASVDSDGKADFNELILDTALPIAEGGTNSAAGLTDDRVMISAGGAIVHSPTITVTELGLLNGLSGIQPLDTALTNIADLVYVSPSFIKLTANDTYAVRTLSEVRTDLGLVIDTNIMAWDAQLDDIAALAYTDSNFIVGDGSNWIAENAATARTSMGAEGILTNEAGLYSALDDVTDFVQAGEANSVDSDMYTDGSIDHEHLAADVISGMVEVTSADEDYILIWDATDSALKKVDMGEVRGAGGGGYTNLTQFIDQTAWRLFYSNNLGDVTELALGTDGQYLKSTGATSAPIFDTPAGTGDALTTDPLSQFAATTSAELAGVISDEIGTGKLRFDTSVTTFSSVDTITVGQAGLILVSAGSGYTLTLPTASGNMGLTYKFVKTDYNYNLITLDGNSTETFNYENSTGSPNQTYPRLNTPLAEVTIVSDGTNWQVINEKLGQVPTASAYLSGNQTGINDATLILVELNTELYDIGSNFNTATHRFTAPIPGYYFISIAVAYSSINMVADKAFQARLDKNGSTIMVSKIPSVSATQGVNSNISKSTNMSATEYLELVTFHDAGADDLIITSGVLSTYMVVRLISKD